MLQCLREQARSGGMNSGHPLAIQHEPFEALTPRRVQGGKGPDNVLGNRKLDVALNPDHMDRLTMGEERFAFPPSPDASGREGAAWSGVVDCRRGLAAVVHQVNLVLIRH